MGRKWPQPPSGSREPHLMWPLEQREWMRQAEKRELLQGEGPNQSPADSDPSLGCCFARLPFLLEWGGRGCVPVLLSPHNQISFVLQIASIASLCSVANAPYQHRVSMTIAFWPRSLPLLRGCIARASERMRRKRRHHKLPTANWVWEGGGEGVQKKIRDSWVVHSLTQTKPWGLEKGKSLQGSQQSHFFLNHWTKLRQFYWKRGQ